MRMLKRLMNETTSGCRLGVMDGGGMTHHTIQIMRHFGDR
jgi:hypothetical protein